MNLNYEMIIENFLALKQWNEKLSMANRINSSAILNKIQTIYANAPSYTLHEHKTLYKTLALNYALLYTTRLYGILRITFRPL